MRGALASLNVDLVRQYPDYVCRVTADEGAVGASHRARFQDVETRSPVILTTSHLLTTGVDAPTCKNVVLVRTVGSMPEFKQIIGRGTRLRPDYGKLAFNIIGLHGHRHREIRRPRPSTASRWTAARNLSASKDRCCRPKSMIPLTRPDTSLSRKICWEQPTTCPANST